MEANTMNPDQTTLLGADSDLSPLFAKEGYLRT